MNKDLRCPHCGEVLPYKTFTKWRYSIYKLEKPAEEGIDAFAVSHNLCQVAKCGELVVIRRYGKHTVGHNEVGEEFADIEIDPSRAPEILYPHCVCDRRLDDAIPEKYRKDFEEACAVVSVSPNASVALGRRILQMLLRREHKIRPSELREELDEFFKKNPNLPVVLRKLHKVRQAGNYGAHPCMDPNTEVTAEEDEAKWTLEMLVSLFDYTFVDPKKEKEVANTIKCKSDQLQKMPKKS